MVLRRFTGADADNLYALDGDPEVMRFLDDGRPKVRGFVEAETLPRILRSSDRPDGLGYWAAVERSTGGFLGWFVLHPSEAEGPSVVELGYRLRRSAWGRGYATEGCRALVHRAFTGLGVRRIFAQTMAVNAASRRVMEKAGLAYTRTFQEDWPEPIAGAEHGEVEYALTRDDWERRTSREAWDRIFSRRDSDLGDEDPWLERRMPLLEAARDAPVLDLGCGAGRDAASLVRRGFRVVAADLSGEALEITRRRAPRVETKSLDLTRPLPFPDAHFGAVVASLSLHYFPWRRTMDAVGETRRCLVPGGLLLARFNSTRDARHAAAEREEIEPNLYLVEGRTKRLFDRRSVDALFAEGWSIVGAEELTVAYGGRPKTLWEVAARKTGGDGRR